MSPTTETSPKAGNGGQAGKTGKAGKKDALTKAKGFSKSRPGTYFTIGTSLLGAVSNIRKARAARAESDTLRLIDAVAKTAAVATGIVLLVRELRRMNDDDILAD
jgi:hypothetical protein